MTQQKFESLTRAQQHYQLLGTGAVMTQRQFEALTEGQQLYQLFKAGGGGAGGTGSFSQLDVVTPGITFHVKQNEFSVLSPEYPHYGTIYSDGQGFVGIGDSYGDGNSTYLSMNDGAGQVNAQAVRWYNSINDFSIAGITQYLGGLFSVSIPQSYVMIGDLSGSVNNTVLEVNDASRQINLKANWTFANGNFQVTGSQFYTTTNGGAIATGATIAVASSSVRVQPAAAVTGVILAAGFDGQRITIVNQSAAANSITFAVAATSHVADGVASVIPGLTSREFAYVQTAALWYPKK